MRVWRCSPGGSLIAVPTSNNNHYSACDDCSNKKPYSMLCCRVSIWSTTEMKVNRIFFTNFYIIAIIISISTCLRIHLSLPTSEFSFTLNWCVMWDGLGCVDVTNKLCNSSLISFWFNPFSSGIQRWDGWQSSFHLNFASWTLCSFSEASAEKNKGTSQLSIALRGNWHETLLFHRPGKVEHTWKISVLFRDTYHLSRWKYSPTPNDKNK